MSALQDRLRSVIGPASLSAPAARPLSPVHPAEQEASVADVLGGDWIDAEEARFLVVERRYAGGHRHGRLSVLDALPPATGVWDRLRLLEGRGSAWPDATSDTPRRLVFLDLETTGLAGGAGTYAFLVGCGWFEGAAFRVRQFFLSSFSAEAAILKAVGDLVRDAAAVVTFNGKTFDVPVLDTRFALHRYPTPFAGLAHVDLLHTARRFWRPADDDRDDEAGEARGRGSCRLSALEQSICGYEREGDVPGFEIPARYFHFVRAGDAGPLEAVLEHNRLDLLSLALLTARASQLLDTGPEHAATAREALGLGFVYERAGLVHEAREAYAIASGMRPMPNGRGQQSACDEPATRAEALRAYALLARRERRFADAARAWEEVLRIRECPAAMAREAAEALAVHHEHRLRDPGEARRFALQSLHYRSTPLRTQAAQHRLARLDRKLGRPAALF